MARFVYSKYLVLDSPLPVRLTHLALLAARLAPARYPLTRLVEHSQDCLIHPAAAEVFLAAIQH